METAAAVEFTSGANRTASSITMRYHGTVSVAYAWMSVPTTTPTFATPAAATPEFCRVTPVVPRSSADEDASDKVVGTIETIRRASIGIVIIVSVRARRRSSSDIPGSDSDPHADSNLRLRVSHRQHQYCQQREIFCVTHENPLRQTRRASGGSENFLRGCGLFWLSFSSQPLAIVPTYLNATGAKKFRFPRWLISTILLKFNHLGIAGEGTGTAFPTRQPTSGTVNPSLIRGLVVVWIAARQEHASILQAGFGHEMAGIVHLAGDQEESSAERIEDLHTFAFARYQQSPRRQLDRFVRQLETAIVE